MRIVLAVVLCVLVGCSKTEDAAGSDTASPELDLAAAEPPPPDPLTQLMAIGSARSAVEFARPQMTDTYNEVSDGATLLAIWASMNLRWSDVYVEQDETSFGMVKKDPSSERGKRMCYSGLIIQIAKEPVPTGELWIGLLMTRRQDLIHFYAAGSSGELVERSRARICGFVTGRYSYDNSGGGTGHAVQMVGMFKLPENVDPS